MVDGGCRMRSRLRFAVLRSRRHGLEQRPETYHEKIMRLHGLLRLHRHLHEVSVLDSMLVLS